MTIKTLNELKKEIRLGELNAKQLGLKYGCHHQTVQRYKREMGLTRPPVDQERVLRLIDMGCTSQEAADIVQTSPRWVRKLKQRRKNERTAKQQESN